MAGSATDRTAEIAVEVDRAFIAGMAYVRDHGGREIVVAHGGPSAVGALIEFRTSLAWPGRVVTGSQFAAVTRYRDPDEARAFVDSSIGRGYLMAVDDTGFRATDQGLAFLSEIHARQGDAIAGHWGAVDQLADLAGRALAAAAKTGGEAFAAMAPPWEPPPTPPALVLLNRLGTLRYHRADAYAAAWAAAGYTAADVQALPPGPARAGVEAETNLRAAAAFSSLREDGRTTFLAGLRALGAGAAQ